MAREEKVLGDFGFIKVKAVIDKKNHCNGYQYAERKGKDSVAFICHDRKRPGECFINVEFTPPTGEMMTRAFGGSIDKNKTKDEIVIDETLEEAGYKVDDERVTCVGQCFVSTQMNQTCYLYLVDVTGIEPVGREPENKIEEMAQPKWVKWAEVYRGDDWKAIAILAKITTK